MGLRSPDAGADLLAGGIRLWVGCEAPPLGVAYHVVAADDELLTLAEWAALRQALASRSVPAVIAAINSTAAQGWWARAVPVLRFAWQTPTAATTLWQAPNGGPATQWVGPSQVWTT